MKQLIIKLLLGKWTRRLAGLAAVALLVVAPELDVAAATEVFAQILSGVVLFLVGKLEKQPDKVRELDVKKP